MGSRLISELRNSSPVARHGAASFKRAESATAPKFFASRQATARIAGDTPATTAVELMHRKRLTMHTRIDLSSHCFRLNSHENYDVPRLWRTTVCRDASLRLFDLRKNAFHLFFAERAQRLTLGVTERAVL
jgi:hypothetical protein